MSGKDQAKSMATFSAMDAGKLGQGTQRLLTAGGLISAIARALFAIPMTAMADQKTVTLKVEGMSCHSCPYQVQSALKCVNEVVTATTTLETHEAVVKYDDAVMNVAALIMATAKFGFPSFLKPNDPSQTQ